MSNEPVFLDTNGWLALMNASDDLHATADHVWRRLGRERRVILLTDLIIAETGNGLARTKIRRDFSRVVTQVLDSPRVKLVFVDRPLLEEAVALYAARPDKDWGLVDCASFLVMRANGAVEAFTSDKHFEQAGFVRLLPIPVGYKN